MSKTKSLLNNDNKISSLLGNAQSMLVLLLLCACPVTAAIGSADEIEIFIICYLIVQHDQKPHLTFL